MRGFALLALALLALAGCEGMAGGSHVTSAVDAEVIFSAPAASTKS